MEFYLVLLQYSSRELHCLNAGGDLSSELLCLPFRKAGEVSFAHRVGEASSPLYASMYTMCRCHIQGIQYMRYTITLYSHLYTV